MPSRQDDVVRLAATAFERESTIKDIVADMRRGWVRLAENLYAFHAEEMWTALGYGSFDEWLAGPDIDLSRRHVYGLVETWRVMVVEKGTEPALLEGVGISKLREQLPAIRRGTITVGQAIADAEALSRQDIREKHDGSGLAPVDGVLEATREPARMQCEACGSWVRVKE